MQVAWLLLRRQRRHRDQDCCCGLLRHSEQTQSAAAGLLLRHGDAAPQRRPEQDDRFGRVERATPDRFGHLLRQVKEQCPPTETTLLVSTERSHALRATA